MTQKIVSITGSTEAVSRLNDIGIFPGQTIRVIQDGVWRIDDRFTVGFRLTNVEIMLEEKL